MHLDTRDLLLRQYDIAWMLMDHHLGTLTTEECLWRPAHAGLHVRRDTSGAWLADWPEHEGYDLGPSSIAWLTWHTGFWLSMLLDDSFGEGMLERDRVVWPGSADGVRLWLGELHERWRAAIAAATDDDLAASDRSRWPIEGRPFADIVAWSTVELTKSAAEIGYARFLYAAREAAT